MLATVLGLVSLSLFPIKLLLGSLCFSDAFRRRDRFFLRLIPGLLIQILLGVILYLLLRETGLWYLENTLYFFLQFIMTTLLLWVSFREELTDLVPCAVAGYLAEHIATQLFCICFPTLAASLYGAEAGAMLRFILLQCGSFLVTLIAIRLFFVRKREQLAPSEVLRRPMMALSVITLTVILLLSSVRDQYAGESAALLLVTRLFSLFSGVMLLYVRYGLLIRGRLEAEREELAQVVAVERKQMEQSRENIELINLKCHDMRHQISLWEKRGLIADQAEMDHMKQLIGIYDAAIHTGNETLDVILTERSLFCEKNGIRLSCIADGEKLSFMSVGDLCALFGNAIENAIEAVTRVEDAENRIISFQVRESKGMLLIAVDNTYQGPLSMECGLPRSGKGDDRHHGFGLRSIRLIAEKYGGEMSVSADELFHLTVLIPLPAQV